MRAKTFWRSANDVTRIKMLRFLVGEGMSIGEICRELWISRAILVRFASKHGVDLPRARRKEKVDNKT